MPIRFRRTFKIFPGVKINVSKGGISVTAGVRGAKLNFSKHGVRQTIGLPGSGLSETSYLFKNDSKSDKEKDKDNDKDREKESERTDADHEEEEGGEVGCFPASCLMLLAFAAVVAYFIADSRGLIPDNFMSDIMLKITQWLRSVGL
jgi:hypothetical protein